MSITQASVIFEVSEKDQSLAIEISAKLAMTENQDWEKGRSFFRFMDNSVAVFEGPDTACFDEEDFKASFGSFEAEGL